MRVARILLPALLAAAPALAAAKIDLLNAPALHSERASSSVMMALQSQGDGYLVSGERGLLLEWGAPGQWQQLESPVSVALTALAALPDEKNSDSATASRSATAFAVGQDAVILRRTPGGEWQKIFDGYQLTRLQIAALERKRDQLQQQLDNPAQDADIAELEFQLEDTGFSLEDAHAELETGPTRPLLDIAARDKNLFAVGAYGTLLKSADGGDSWQLLSDRLENPDRFHLNAISASADGSLYIVGEAGLGFVSRDGGDSWARLDLPYDGSLFGIAAQGAGGSTNGTGNLVAFGLQGNLLISRDGGNSWQHRHIGAGASLLGGTISERGEVFLVGHGGLVASFPLANPDALKVRKHPSGAAFSAVQVSGEQLILAGQFGLAVWNKSAWNKKEVAGDAE